MAVKKGRWKPNVAVGGNNGGRMQPLLIKNGEAIAIELTRELLTEVPEFLHFGGKGAEGLLAVRTLGNDVTIRMNGSRTSIIGAKHVMTDAIDTDDINLILDGAGWKERIPGQAALLWPIGDTNQDIVGCRICPTRPDREAEVIADKEEEANAPPLDDDTFKAFDVAKILMTDVEEMMLVIMVDVSFWSNEITAITMEQTRRRPRCTIGRKRHSKRTADSRLITCREIEKMLLNAGSRLKGTRLGQRNEAGRTHLRKDEQIRIWKRGELLLNLGIVS